MSAPAQAAIRAELQQSLADRRLDKQERDALRSLARELPPDLRRFARNTAFDLSRDTLNADVDADSAGTFRVLGWLEQVCKALDVSDAAPPQQAAYFSPGRRGQRGNRGDECRRVLVNLMDQARDRLEICVFTISDNQIAESILQAHRRGVHVRIVTDNDKRDDRGSDVYRLADAGVPVVTDCSDKHMHHKFAIFDAQTLVTGSFNWTRSATVYNQENILTTTDARLVQDYAAEFDRLWDQWI